MLLVAVAAAQLQSTGSIGAQVDCYQRHVGERWVRLQRREAQKHELRCNRRVRQAVPPGFKDWQKRVVRKKREFRSLWYTAIDPAGRRF